MLQQGDVPSVGTLPKNNKKLGFYPSNRAYPIGSLSSLVKRRGIPVLETLRASRKSPSTEMAISVKHSTDPSMESETKASGTDGNPCESSPSPTKPFSTQTGGALPALAAPPAPETNVLKTAVGGFPPTPFWNRANPKSSFLPVKPILPLVPDTQQQGPGHESCRCIRTKCPCSFSCKSGPLGCREPRTISRVRRACHLPPFRRSRPFP